MLSEDTGTQGSGNYELELGYDWIHQSGLQTFLFQPQLSWGESATLDLIVQPSWLTGTGGDGHRDHALGDTNIDLKWRLFGSAPWSLGVRAGVEAPTAEDGFGLPRGHFSPHAILVATGDYAPWTIDANAGLAHVPQSPQQRSELAHYSVAITRAVGANISMVLDTSLDSASDRNAPAYQAVALLGAIYTLHPGLDIDAGFRGRLNRAGPPQQFLLGITFRGAP